MNKETTQKSLAQIKALEVPTHPMVAQRFKNIYTTFHGKDASKYYEAEKFHFSKLLTTTPALQSCTVMSLYGVFLDAAVHGLSFDPTLKHCYIVPYKFKEGDNWVTRAQLQISGQGELILRANGGQIKYADNPVLVYEGDEFMYGTKDSTVFIQHQVALPRKSDVIIACYIKITRPDGTIDYKMLTMPELEQLRKFSKDPNSKAWTDGLPGMMQAKTIKHAFRSYPKLRILNATKNTVLQNELEDQPDIEDLYNLDAEVVDTTTGEVLSTEAPPAEEAPANNTNHNSKLSDF